MTFHRKIIDSSKGESEYHRSSAPDQHGWYLGGFITNFSWIKLECGHIINNYFTNQGSVHCGKCKELHEDSIYTI